MSFTSQQAEAIYTLDKNLVVAAGAGSGKTRVLVERYLELLDQHGWALNAIVAITFTREAALEMRNRVRVELEKRLQTAEGDARSRWSDLLGQMDSARIDTIHGLCATILRANAAEADLDPAFEVLDEIDAALMLDDVINDVLQALTAEDTEDLASLFAQYDTQDIRAALNSTALMGTILPDTVPDGATLYEQWQQAWQTRFTQGLQALRKPDGRFVGAVDWQPPYGFPQNDKLYNAWANVHQSRAVLLTSDDITEILEAAQYLSTSAGINLVGGTKANWGDAPTLETAKTTLRFIRDTCIEFIKANPLLSDLDQHVSQLAGRWHKLIQRVQQGYADAKRTAGVLDFNDLEARTALLLGEFADVRARYQGLEFKALLVDEFQDTNDAQWTIVKSLADIQQGGTLFVVGDLKQSIYGFRGADVRVFSSVQAEISATLSGKALPLSESFRAHPGLIETFNELFRRILTRELDSPVHDYEIEFDAPMSANRQDLPAFAPVDLVLLSKPPKSKLSAWDMRQWEAYLIAQRLQQMVQEQTPIWDRGELPRPFHYGDAALLFQSMGSVTVYEDVFKALNIPFVTVAGRGYYNRQEVWDLLNLLKALHNPLDNLSLAAALRSPLFGLSDDALLLLRRVGITAEENKPVSLWDALAQVGADTIEIALPDEERQRVKQAHEQLRALRAFAGRVTVSELLRQALAKTGYLAVLTGLPDGARRRRNVEKLLAIAEQSGRVSPGAFWRYLDDLTAQEVREGEALLDTEGAVRLMTVHASKGLEFPVVFLPDASWTRSGGNSPLLMLTQDGYLIPKVFDERESKFVKPYAYQQAEQIQQLREAAERKRLLYVAATRARDLLIVSGTVKNGDAGWQADGWLGQIITAIEAESAGHDALLDFTASAPVRVTIPTYDETIADKLAVSDSSKPAWQQVAALAADVPAVKPPLMQPVVIPRERFLGHLAATQLADIGGAKHATGDRERDYYAANVRRIALHDTPATIKETVRAYDPRVTGRVIGEIVHEALRYWRFPDNTDDIVHVLQSYAWQHNVTDTHDVDQAVNAALSLLTTFKQSDVYGWITEARARKLPIHPELPFIYRTEKRILHGVIDVLVQRRDKQWAVVDYKTVYVPEHGSEEAAQAHAQRYILQVGAYAAAVQAQIKTVPEVYIHYIRYNRTIQIPTKAWQAELSQLEAYIGDVIGDEIGSRE